MAKGTKRGSQLVLTVVGGRTSKGEDVVQGLPKFVLGARYVVLCSADLGSEANGYLPVVYFDQGMFLIAPERPGGLPVVHDPYGRPVVGARDGHLVVVGSEFWIAQPRPQPQAPRIESSFFGGTAFEILFEASDPGTRMREASFLELVRDLAQAK